MEYGACTTPESASSLTERDVVNQTESAHATDATSNVVGAPSFNFEEDESDYDYAEEEEDENENENETDTGDATGGNDEMIETIVVEMLGEPCFPSLYEHGYNPQFDPRRSAYNICPPNRVPDWH
ncbi:hypothetical protein Pelo_11374 [Pelomyxa schiedti]|nr:hypothetical protein Pelo_11374 [Pelomyxa schiedti]